MKPIAIIERTPVTSLTLCAANTPNNNNFLRRESSVNADRYPYREHTALHADLAHDIDAVLEAAEQLHARAARD